MLLFALLNGTLGGELSESLSEELGDNRPNFGKKYKNTPVIWNTAGFDMVKRKRIEAALKGEFDNTPPIVDAIEIFENINNDNLVICDKKSIKKIENKEIVKKMFSTFRDKTHEKINSITPLRTPHIQKPIVRKQSVSLT